MDQGPSLAPEWLSLKQQQHSNPLTTNGVPTISRTTNKHRSSSFDQIGDDYSSRRFESYYDDRTRPTSNGSNFLGSRIQGSTAHLRRGSAPSYIPNLTTSPPPSRSRSRSPSFKDLIGDSQEKSTEEKGSIERNERNFPSLGRPPSGKTHNNNSHNGSIANFSNNINGSNSVSGVANGMGMMNGHIHGNNSGSTITNTIVSSSTSGNGNSSPDKKNVWKAHSIPNCNDTNNVNPDHETPHQAESPWTFNRSPSFTDLKPSSLISMQNRFASSPDLINSNNNMVGSIEIERLKSLVPTPPPLPKAITNHTKSKPKTTSKSASSSDLLSANLTAPAINSIANNAKILPPRNSKSVDLQQKYSLASAHSRISSKEMKTEESTIILRRNSFDDYTKTKQRSDKARSNSLSNESATNTAASNTSQVNTTANTINKNSIQLQKNEDKAKNTTRNRNNFFEELRKNEEILKQKQEQVIEDIRQAKEEPLHRSISAPIVIVKENSNHCTNKSDSSTVSKSLEQEIKFLRQLGWVPDDEDNFHDWITEEELQQCQKFIPKMKLKEKFKDRLMSLDISVSIWQQRHFNSRSCLSPTSFNSSSDDSDDDDI